MGTGLFLRAYHNEIEEVLRKSNLKAIDNDRSRITIQIYRVNVDANLGKDYLGVHITARLKRYRINYKSINCQLDKRVSGRSKIAYERSGWRSLASAYPVGNRYDGT